MEQEHKSSAPFKPTTLAERTRSKNRIRFLQSLTSAGEDYLAHQQKSTFNAIFQRETEEGETSQINKCRDFLNSGSHNNYSVDADETGILIGLVERFLAEKIHLLMRYGDEQEEASGGNWDGMIPAEINKQLPPHELFSSWVGAEKCLQGNEAIRIHAQDILKSIRDFMTMRGKELRGCNWEVF
ncbi:MAG: hypothetical protein Q9191_007526 [Dirinaria sp. TL-2023a]